MSAELFKAGQQSSRSSSFKAEQQNSRTAFQFFVFKGSKELRS